MAGRFAKEYQGRACGLNVFLGMIAIMLLEIFDALADKAGKEARHSPGHRLFSHGDEVSRVFLLDAGEVKLSQILSTDRELILQHARGPAILAEASLYAERQDCDAICLSDCRVRSLPLPRFLSLIEENAVLSSAWAAHLARNLMAARLRAEILTLKTAEDRLEAWLGWRNGELPAKADLKALAAELGVTRKTLSRALAQRGR